jgi:transcriptional regulator with XRE-family HTH domain
MAWTADEVRDLRTQLGLTVGDFAKLFGVDQRTVYRWESGRARPSGAAEAVMNGLREKLGKDPDNSDFIIKLLIGAAAVGGLAFLIVKLLDLATEKQDDDA